jgi:hypothetical protein
MTDTDDRLQLTVEGPAAFAGALVDSLRRHGVEVFETDEPAEARTLDTDDVVTVPLVVAADDVLVERAVAEFTAEFPEAVVREGAGGLG